MPDHGPQTQHIKPQDSQLDGQNSELPWDSWPLPKAEASTALHPYLRLSGPGLQEVDVLYSLLEAMGRGWGVGGAAGPGLKGLEQT